MIRELAEWFKNLFMKPEQFYHTPEVYGTIEFPEQARKKAVFEDEIKEFKIIELGKTKKVFKYSEQLVEAYQKKYKIPIIDFTSMEDEELPIDSIDYPGVIEDDA